MIIIFSWACNSRPTEKAFDLLYQNRYDSAVLFFENAELTYLFENDHHLEHQYSYTIGQDRLIVDEVDGNSIEPDTIHFNWIDQENKIALSDEDLVRLFKYEVIIPIQLAIFNRELGDNKRANAWLTETEDVDLNYFIGKTYYDEYEMEYALSYLEKAYNGGSQDAGLILSSVYSLLGNRDKGITLLKSLAQLQNSNAMVRLGDIYDTYSSSVGLYIPPDDAEDISSFIWYKKATELDNPIAMQRIGYIYQAGVNRVENLDSAIFWYNKSSDLGEASATVELALISLSSKDIERGLILMNKAVNQHAELGLFEYGEIYEYGIGVKENKSLALEYYKKADSLGSPVAYIRIEKLEKKIRRL